MEAKLGDIIHGFEIKMIQPTPPVPGIATREKGWRVTLVKEPDLSLIVHVPETLPTKAQLETIVEYELRNRRLWLDREIYI